MVFWFRVWLRTWILGGLPGSGSGLRFSGCCAALDVAEIFGFCVFFANSGPKPALFATLFVKMHHLGPLKPHRSDHPPPNPAAATPLNASGDDQAGIATTKLPAQMVPSQTTRTGSNANAVVVNLKSFSRTL